MIGSIFTHVWRRLAGLRRDSEGFVIMSTLALFLFIFILCSFVYAVGETIHQKMKLQNACDAAAYSAAVVQADGLSRMAAVNRAMSWSYVQMTNRQMDYITYRWLKLTCKRFQEDKDNAHDYAANIVLCVDPEFGPWAILEALASGLISKIFELDCDTGGGHSRDNGYGRSWWCGRKPGTAEEIDLNPRKLAEPIRYRIGDSVTSEVLNQSIFPNRKSTIEEKLLNPIGSLIDRDRNSKDPKDWGVNLGKWIDYDKRNIEAMNKTMGRINRQMVVSMRMTAENILKSMLVDPRMPASESLKDYYISIHIPEGRDPYADADQYSSAPKSFFSPLYNTEADELLFLNMQSSADGNRKLHNHFPTIAGSMAYGLDQWFIRGRGVYSVNDDVEHCYDSQDDDTGSYRGGSNGHGGRSGYVSPVNRSGDPVLLLKTERDEGSPGIQRVYKDANLNETRAGFITTGSGSKIAVTRGNHLIDLESMFSAGFRTVAGYFSRSSPGGGASSSIIPGDTSVDDVIGEYEADILNYQAEIQNLQAENASLMLENPPNMEKINSNNARIQSNQRKIQDCRNEISRIRNRMSNPGFGSGGLIGGGGSGSIGSGSIGSGGNQNSWANFFGDFVSGMLGSFLSKILDVSPSCGNVVVNKTGTPTRDDPRDPTTGYYKNFMCHSVNGTAALHAEYRWSTSKWYCCTTWRAYLLGVIFGLASDPIFCDLGYKTFAKTPWGRAIKARGWGHYPFFPKAFCGSGPTYALEGYLGWVPKAKKLLDVIPPLDPEEITGDRHGYMDSTYDVAGLLKPLFDIMGESSTSRDEYESCVVFPDGPFEFMNGAASAGYIQGHARIYGDDKELFNNRFVGARCKPWVLNERFFAGDGTIVIGAAMKHTNPFVQLFNLVNSRTSGSGGSASYSRGDETQRDAETTVFSAFNIPEGNFMWTMSAARAGVRHTRRNGAFDQPRQYQITYDSISDPENLGYEGDKMYVLQQDSGTAADKGRWLTVNEWGRKHSDNPKALSRIYRPADEDQANVPIWAGCVCPEDVIQGSNYSPTKRKCNARKFHDMWNLCETDWDATLIPVRYAAEKAVLYLDKGSGGSNVERIPLNEQDYAERISLIEVNYDKDFSVFGDGRQWTWNSISVGSTVMNPFIMNGWKPADSTFFEDLVNEKLPGVFSTGLSTVFGELNLDNKVPEGKEEKPISVFLILKDKVL